MGLVCYEDDLFMGKLLSDSFQNRETTHTGIEYTDGRLEIWVMVHHEFSFLFSQNSDLKQVLAYRATISFLGTCVFFSGPDKRAE